MNRRRRTEILIRGDRSLAEDLCRGVEELVKIQVIEDPNDGLVMIKMRESAQNTLFYLGEMLVTEAKVLVEGHVGLGIVQGHEPELAYQLAVIDGAFNGGLALTEEWLEPLEESARAIQFAQAQEEAQLLKTRVNFETMDV